jgi:hypothetical protein
MIVSLEGALLLVYCTRSSGEAWQQKTATAFSGRRRWLCMPAMREALPGAVWQRSLS